MTLSHPTACAPAGTCGLHPGAHHGLHRRIAPAPRRAARPLGRGLGWLPGIAALLLLAGCQSPSRLAAPRAGLDPALAPQRLLQEAPRTPKAAPPAPPLPDAVARALLPPLAGQPAAMPALAEQRFDVTVTNATPAQVYQAIGSGSRYSILLAPGLTGAITLNLKEVNVREALDALRELYGFEYRVEDTRIYVIGAAMQTRVFQVSFPATRRVSRSDTRVVSGGITGSVGKEGAQGATPGVGGGQEGSQVSTTQDADFWRELDATLKMVVGIDGGRKVVMSPQTGVVVIRALPKELREVERLLVATKLAAERQVMLEAKIVEVTLSDGAESGINWSAFTAAGNHRWSVGADRSRINVPGSLGRAAGIPTGSLVTSVDGNSAGAGVVANTLGQLLASPLASGTASTLGVAFTSNSFAALLAFLETQGSVQVLSSPRVAATNNQKAVLRVGTDDFFITNVSTTTTASASGSVSTPSIQVQPFFSGISLDVTPQIDADGMVILHVRPTVSEVSERTRVVNLGNMGSFTLPLASSRVNEADTVVRVADGVTVAIGGLMTQAQSTGDERVPVAGDVPVLGHLFKRTQRSLVKRELVFLLKPTVVRGDEQWQQEVAATGDRMRLLLAGPSGTAKEQ